MEKTWESHEIFFLIKACIKTLLKHHQFVQLIVDIYWKIGSFWSDLLSELIGIYLNTGKPGVMCSLKLQDFLKHWSNLRRRKMWDVLVVTHLSVGVDRSAFSVHLLE